MADPDPTEDRTDLRDCVVVRNRQGHRMAWWLVDPGAPVGDVEPWVRHGVERLGWAMSRRSYDASTLALPAGLTRPDPDEVSEALPPAGDVTEKGREGG